MAYEIDKNISIPLSRASGYADMPLEKMEVGDSFFISADKNHKPANLRARLRYFGKQLSREFIVRLVADGLRVWRIN